MESEKKLKLGGIIVLVQGALLGLGLLMLDGLTIHDINTSKIRRFTFMLIVVMIIFIVSGILALIDKKYRSRSLFIPIIFILGLATIVSVASIFVSFFVGVIMLLFFGVPFAAFAKYYVGSKMEEMFIKEEPQKKSKEQSEKIYIMAMDFIKKEKYDLALQMFKKIPNYKDSRKYINNLENK